jgi:HD superfamily phosphohydrolase
MSYKTQPSEGVDTVFDAVHGNIHLSDIYPYSNSQLRRLISADFMQRLRRIKQLGYVSQNYLSAQHNRYAHALGTLHMMRGLLSSVNGDGKILERALPAARKLAKDDAITIAQLQQHLLVTALIQDIGELPYEKATSGLFSPGPHIRSTVASSKIDIAQLKSDKDLFTLYYIWNDTSYADHFTGLSRPLLTYLISGLFDIDTILTPDEITELASLHELTDGTLDADRLDYVYRDAFHTIGLHHSPGALIESVRDYHESGPTLGQIRPVTDFLITRALLWSNVYLSPESRFRLILLRIVLQEIVASDVSIEMFVKFKPEAMAPEDFAVFDDLFIDNMIRELSHKKRFRHKVTEAIRILHEGAANYTYKWVRIVEPTAALSLSKTFTLPEKFYFDTYADYRERSHTLYEPKTIRIEGDRYDLIDNKPVFLEDCIGPFRELLIAEQWEALPMRDYMSWFIPDVPPKDGAWKALMENIGGHELSMHLQFSDPLTGVEFPPDTRQLLNFDPPAIFIAYSTRDMMFLKRIIGILHAERRQYYVLLSNSEGISLSTQELSERAVDQAGAAIIICSQAYAERFASDASSGIHIEMERMVTRFQRGEIPVVPITLDHYSSYLPSFPLRRLTADGNLPLIGDPLRRASPAVIRKVVIDALNSIDMWTKTKAR